VRFGISYNTGAYGVVDPDAMIAVAQHAEDCGFESFYVPEHVALYPGASLGGVAFPPDLPIADPLRSPWRHPAVSDGLSAPRRAERRRRVAEPDLNFRGFCRLSKLPQSAADWDEAGVEDVDRLVAWLRALAGRSRRAQSGGYYPAARPHGGATPPARVNEYTLPSFEPT